MTTSKKTRSRKNSPAPANESSPPAPAEPAPAPTGKASVRPRAEKVAKVAAKAQAAAPAPAEDLPAAPDPVPAGVLELMDVFTTEMDGVAFPDVDAEVLMTSCEQVRAADSEVRRLFADLEAAQVRLTEERARLHRTSERGLAYARVFAGDDEALLARLDGVQLGGPKKVSRKAKTKPKAAKDEVRTRGTTDGAPDSELGKLSA